MNRLESYEAAITAQLTVQPSMTLPELRDWLEESYPLETSVSASSLCPSDRYWYKDTVHERRVLKNTGVGNWSRL